MSKGWDLCMGWRRGVGGLATLQFIGLIIPEVCAKVSNCIDQELLPTNDYPVRKSQAPRIATYDFPLYQYQRGCLPCLFRGHHLPVRFAVVMP